jgi:hypothetical protein
MVYLMNLERLGMGNLFWAWWLFITIGERVGERERVEALGK